MSVRLTDEGCVALVDNVTGRALPLTFRSQDHALDFLRWSHDEFGLAHDPRGCRLSDLFSRYEKWLSQRVDPMTDELLVRTSNAAEEPADDPRIAQAEYERDHPADDPGEADHAAELEAARLK